MTSDVIARSDNGDYQCTANGFEDEDKCPFFKLDKELLMCLGHRIADDSVSSDVYACSDKDAILSIEMELL